MSPGISCWDEVFLKVAASDAGALRRRCCFRLRLAHDFHPPNYGVRGVELDHVFG